jgi:hypothetical protein
MAADPSGQFNTSDTAEDDDTTVDHFDDELITGSNQHNPHAEISRYTANIITTTNVTRWTHHY